MSKRLTCERGAVMPAAIAMLFALIAMIGVAAKVASTTVFQSDRDRNVKRALTAADQAVNLGIYRLNAVPTPAKTDCVRVLSNGSLDVYNETVSSESATPNDGWCDPVAVNPSEDSVQADGQSYSYTVSVGEDGPPDSNLQERTIIATGKAGNGEVTRRVMSSIIRRFEPWGKYPIEARRDIKLAHAAWVSQECRWCNILDPGASVRSWQGKITMMAQSRICGQLQFSAKTPGDSNPISNDPDVEFDTPPWTQTFGNFLLADNTHWCWADYPEYQVNTTHTGVGIPTNPIPLKRWKSDAAPDWDPPGGTDGAGLDQLNVVNGSLSVPGGDTFTKTGNGAQFSATDRRLVVRAGTLTMRQHEYDLCYMEVSTGGKVFLDHPDGVVIHLRDPNRCSSSSLGSRIGEVAGQSVDKLQFYVNAGVDAIVNTSGNFARINATGSTDETNKDDTVWIDSGLVNGVKLIVNAPNSLVKVNGGSVITSVKGDYVDVDNNAGIEWDPTAADEPVGSQVYTPDGWTECTVEPPTPTDITSGC